MPKVKTIILDGTETAVKFEKGYSYYVITNMGDSELYASGSPGITAYADGVYTILPGMETRISPELSADTVFLLGSGMVQVRAEEIAVPTSFNSSGKGGGSGGVTDYSLLENKPSINSVELDGNKTLTDLGISNFDGNYTSLTNAPVVYGTKENATINGRLYIAVLEHINVTCGFNMLISVSAKNNDKRVPTFMGVLTVRMVENGWDSTVSFTPLGSNGISMFKLWATFYNWRDLYISIENSMMATYNNLDVQILYDPNSIPERSEWGKTEFIKFPETYNMTPSGELIWQKVFDTTTPTPITVDSALSETSENPVQNKVITEALNSKLDFTDISDWAKSDTKPSYTAEEVGADATGSASTALTAANSYTDIAIANLVGTAPEDLNTLEELAQAYKDNKEIADILSEAITKKQNILYLGDIATNNVDWNTLKTTGFYQIGVEEKLSDNSTHGLGGVYGYGMLIIIPGRYTVYQLYINDNTEVYQRQLYNTWRNWKRIDAGAVTKETLNLGNVDNTADADKTVKAANNLLCIDLGNMLDNNVGEIKTAIINAIHSCSKNTFFVIKIVMRTNILNNWDNDDFVSSATLAAYQITSISMHSGDPINYGRFLITSYDNHNKLYYFTLLNNVISRLHTLVESDDDGLMSAADRAKLDSITPEMIEKLKNL